MEKITIKTENVLAAYRVLSAAKYGKLSDDDKIKVFKICVALKPIATKSEEDSKDAAEKLKPSEDYDQKLQQAQEYERVSRDPKADASTLEMGPAEYNDFIREMQKYQQLVAKALTDELDKEVTIEIEKISQEAFVKLMNSNDWTFAQVEAVGEVVM